MKCEICHRGPHSDTGDNVALYRVNEYGVTGIWRCWDDLTPLQREGVDPIVRDITQIIEEDNATRKPL